MAGDIDPTRTPRHEPISDEQKSQIGTELVTSIRGAITYDRLHGKDRNFFIFNFDDANNLLDDEGSVPEYMTVAPDGETQSTRDFRIIVKKTGLHTDIPRTELFKVALFKNTEISHSVSKATIRPEHVIATQQDGGVSDEELGAAALVAASGLGTTTAEQAYTDVLEPEIQAQWALGECSREEADHLLALLGQAQPSSISLMDIATGRY
jgi:hypothetical protein